MVYSPSVHLIWLNPPKNDFLAMKIGISREIRSKLIIHCSCKQQKKRLTDSDISSDVFLLVKWLFCLRRCVIDL